jgi:hypothetical protein
MLEISGVISSSLILRANGLTLGRRTIQPRPQKERDGCTVTQIGLSFWLIEKL